MTSRLTTSRYPRVELTVIPAFTEARRIADTVGRVTREREAMAPGPCYRGGGTR